ncbi:MAG: DUF177 domain-containing protein [Pseudomonadales bacterium]|nr:DUF177 domain-containing protein [Pseudomonadales bacterium]MCP5171573.1 DUF177 domain-containing protein [Pseudomonadales bacterium]
MSTAPQRKILPRCIEPRRLANQGVTLTGEIAAEQCNRLAGAVLQIIAPITASLQFDLDEQRHRVVTGEVSTQVSIECHRCLEPMAVPLSTRLSAMMVWSDDEAASVPKEFDPWVVESDSADIIALVEEELLLALPIVNYHPEDKCSGAAGYSTGAIDEPEQSGRKNPFDVLARLKQ